MQPELTGPGDLLDEGEPRWLLTSWLGTWVEVMPFRGNAGQGASLGGTCNPGRAGGVRVHEAHPSGDAQYAYVGVRMRRNS